MLLGALQAQFAKARMRARRNARRAGDRQRGASPRVTEKETKSLPQRVKKFFRSRGCRSVDLGRLAISLAMIRNSAVSNELSIAIARA
jgi:hypothetical protein